MPEEQALSQKEFLTTLSLLQPKVRDNVEIIERGDLQYPLLHISVGKQDTLTPNISRRAGNKEDNTVPRVHASTNLHGCMVGYASVMYNFYEFIPGKASVASSGKSVSYRGGYYILAIDYEHAIKPNSKLVYDAKESDEVWLITYDQNTIQYPCHVAGKIFPKQVTSKAVWNSTADSIVEYYIEVTEPSGIALTRKQFLQPGYYKVLYSEKTKTYTTQVISKQVFEYEKKQTASTLSHKEDVPPQINHKPSYLDW